MGIWGCGGAGVVTIGFSGVLRGGYDILRFFSTGRGPHVIQKLCECMSHL